MLFYDTTAKGVESGGFSLIKVIIISFNRIDFLLVGIKNNILSIFFLRQNEDVLRGNTQCPSAELIKDTGIINHFWDVLKQLQCPFFFLLLQDLNFVLVNLIQVFLLALQLFIFFERFIIID